MIPNLIDLLNEIFDENGAAKAGQLLKDHDLYEIINKTITNANNGLTNDKELNRKSSDDILAALAVNLLNHVNHCVGVIQDKELKHRIKYTVAQIAQDLLRKYLLYFEGDSAKALDKLAKAVIAACTASNYDITDLETFFPVRSMAVTAEIIQQKAQQKKEKTKPIRSYEWKSNCMAFLDEFTAVLKRRGWIKSSTDFKKLFNTPGPAFKLAFDLKHRDIIIMLFKILTCPEKGTIKCKIGTGCFVPLKQHAVDFEGKPLLPEKPNSLFFAIKKSPKRKADAIKEAKKIISISQVGMHVDVDLVLTLTKVNTTKRSD